MNISAEEDPDLLMDLLGHAGVLKQLRGEALTRDELAQRLDVSTATSYRYTNQLAELNVVAESGEVVGLTLLGETIADEVTTFQTTVTNTLHADDDSQEIFTKLLRHSPGLQALSRRPLDRRELEERLGVSNTTAYRITRALEDRDLVEKTNGRYEITTMGEEILEVVSTFESNVRTAVRLGPVLRALREDGPSIDLNAFAGATVTTSSGYTFSPQNRCLELLDESDTLRTFLFESVVSSCLVEVQQHLDDGLVSEVINLPGTAAKMLAEFPDRAVEVCQDANVTLYLHDDLWYSLAVFDKRIAIGVPDSDTGACHTLVDTDALAARAWAEAVHESYKEDAVHLPRFDPFTLRQVVEQLPAETDPEVELL